MFFIFNFSNTLSIILHAIRVWPWIQHDFEFTNDIKCEQSDQRSANTFL